MTNIFFLDVSDDLPDKQTMFSFFFDKHVDLGKSGRFQYTSWKFSIGQLGLSKLPFVIVPQ